MLFAVCADRGSPGSTTTALALAAARGLSAVVVEVDPYGGDLALRCRIKGSPLPPTPTVLGLGASMGSELDLWREGTHQLSPLVRVVPGTLTAEQGSNLSWSSVTAAVESQLVPVFADLGRIHTSSPSMPIATAADVLIVVCRGDVESVQHLIWRLERLVPSIAERKGRPPVTVPVVVASRRTGRRAAREVATLLAETGVGPTVGGVGWLAWDSTSVSRLEHGDDPWSKSLHRSPLMKSARTTVGLLGQLTGLDHADPLASAGRRADG